MRLAIPPSRRRWCEIGLIAAAEIVPDSDTEQWDVLAIRPVNEQRMSCHGLVSTELFVIEPCGGHDVKIRQAKHVLCEKRRVAGRALIRINRPARLVVTVGARISATELEVWAPRCVGGVADGQSVAGPPVVQEPAIEPRVVKALRGERGGNCAPDAGRPPADACNRRDTPNHRRFPRQR